MLGGWAKELAAAMGEVVVEWAGRETDEASTGKKGAVGKDKDGAENGGVDERVGAEAVRAAGLAFFLLCFAAGRGG